MPLPAPLTQLLVPPTFVQTPLTDKQVHDYNRVVSGLDARERVLFHDRLRALDRRVTPGTSKLAWTSDRVTLEFYFREVRRRAR